jgi:hypothetical protein
VKRRRRFKQVQTLEERLAEFAEESRAKAKSLPPGGAREEALRKARQAEAGLQMNALVTRAGSEFLTESLPSQRAGSAL